MKTASADDKTMIKGPNVSTDLEDRKEIILASTVLRWTLLSDHRGQYRRKDKRKTDVIIPFIDGFALYCPVSKLQEDGKWD